MKNKGNRKRECKMSPIKDIYEEEFFNHSKIILRPEGAFLKEYEHSAYLLGLSTKTFKPTKRFFQEVRCRDCQRRFSEEFL